MRGLITAAPGPRQATLRAADNPNGFDGLPVPARLYVAAVIAAGAVIVAAALPVDVPRPFALVALLALTAITSAWKVNLPLDLACGSTLSVSYAANLMALLLLGPHEALLVAVAGAWVQCTFNVKQRYPLYRTVFSMAAQAITMYATATVYLRLDGVLQPTAFTALPRALVGALAAYFAFNTGLVAAAVALTRRRNILAVWLDNFVWSGPSVLVAGAAGALAAVIVERGDHWMAMLMAAPVYLTYWTYRVFLGRIEDEQRHLAESQRLHAETVEALIQAQQAERALTAEKQRLAVTLRSIGDGVITTDLNGTILLINRVAETLTGWRSTEAIGRPLSIVFHRLERGTRERCDDSVEGLTRWAERTTIPHAALLVARDRSERPIEEIFAPLRDEDGRTIGLVVAFRDISEALKAQEERARVERAASLGVLAGGIAHDFTDTLTTILGNVSYARATLPPSNPVEASLAAAERACIDARQLTWRLLGFSRGGMPIKKTLALEPALQEAASLALRGSNVTWTLEADRDLWAVSADERQIMQVFNSVLDNAHQAMPAGGTIRIRAENVIETARRSEHALAVEPGPHVRITIADTGTGIPPEHLHRIFDPYFSTKQAGRGLGLATSYSIIKNHGGFVTVDSRLGHGTTITVSLPATAQPELVEAAPAVWHDDAATGMAKRATWTIH
jgi:PAS domain S-box-containing protein